MDSKCYNFYCIQQKCCFPSEKDEIATKDKSSIEYKGRRREKPRSKTNKKLFEPTKVQEVTIGRGADCTFLFAKDKSFSRIQTSFLYDENTKEWTVIDGSKTKSSTNGTWVFGSRSFEIKDQMIAEILTSKVKFKFLKNEL